jgi:hypothetical protein
LIALQHVTDGGRKMGRLIVVNAMSVDGFYEGPHKDVSAVPMDVAFSEYNLERMQTADAVLLGAKSYAGFLQYWPHKEDDTSALASEREFAKLYKVVEKVVVSNHATPPTGSHPGGRTSGSPA